MKKIALTLLWVTTNLSAQSSLETQPGDERLAPVGEESAKGLPGDKAYPPLEERIKSSREVLSEGIRNPNYEPEESIPLPPAEPVAEEKPKPVEVKPTKKIVQAKVPRYEESVEAVSQPPRRDVFLSETGVTVFKENFENWEDEVVQVPALSTALATIQFGEEVTASTKDYVTAKLDYAFLGANGAIVELTGCVVDIDVKANFHTSSVKGSLNKIVCTGPDGLEYKQPVQGKIISAASEYGGVKSDIIMAGPAKGMALEALQSAIKGFGEAMAFTETTRQGIASQFATREVENVSGNQDRYIGGKVLESTGSFLQYVVDFYKGLEPSLALAPGAKVHVLIRDSLQVPSDFFKGQLNKNEIKRSLSHAPN